MMVTHTYISADTRLPSGISPVFPDETTEFRLPSGNQGSFPDEEGKKLRPSGKTCVFPDETTEKDKAVWESLRISGRLVIFIQDRISEGAC